MTIDELQDCIQLYGNDIYSFCRQLVCDRQEADDLYQDTFLLAVEHLNRLDASKNPKSYLLSAALRIWKNKKRKFAWRQRIAPTGGSIDEAKDFISPVPTAEELVICAEERDIVSSAVQRLDDKYRIPILLYYTEQLSVGEIASMLALPAGTVKSRLHSARKILERELEVFFS